MVRCSSLSFHSIAFCLHSVCETPNPNRFPPNYSHCLHSRRLHFIKYLLVHHSYHNLSFIDNFSPPFISSSFCRFLVLSSIVPSPLFFVFCSHSHFSHIARRYNDSDSCVRFIEWRGMTILVSSSCLVSSVPPFQYTLSFSFYVSSCPSSPLFFVTVLLSLLSDLVMISPQPYSNQDSKQSY